MPSCNPYSLTWVSLTLDMGYLFLVFFGTLHSDAYIFPFLFCFSLLLFSQLFVRPPQTAILLFSKSGSVSFGSLFLSPGSWCTQSFVCTLQESVSPVLCKFCNQIPLASKVKFSGDSQSLCQIPRLGNLLLVLELS